MNRTTFRDLWVGGEHVLLRFVDLLFKKEKTNPLRHQIQFCIWAN